MGRELANVTLRQVQLSSSRPTIPETVNALAESMRVSGLINPVIVKRAVIYDGSIMCEGFKVIAGNHRVSAARALGWDQIEAFVVDGDGSLEAELIEIDENLCRAELSAAQRASAIARRKEVWEALHHESATNCRGLGGRGNTEFASETAAAGGENVRAVQRHVARAAALGPDLQAVIGTSLDKGVELDALKDMEPEERRELIERARAGEVVSAREPKDDQLASRLVSVCVGDFARMLGKVTPDEVAQAMVKQAINPELKPYVEAFYNAFRAARERMRAIYWRRKTA